MPRRSSHGISITRYYSLSVRSRLSSTRHSSVLNYCLDHFRSASSLDTLKQTLICGSHKQNTVLFQTLEVALLMRCSTVSGQLKVDFWLQKVLSALPPVKLCSLKLSAVTTAACFHWTGFGINCGGESQDSLSDSTEFVPRGGIASCAMFSSDAATGKPVSKGSQLRR